MLTVGIDPGADYGDVHLESPPPERMQDRIPTFVAAHAGATAHAG